MKKRCIAPALAALLIAALLCGCGASPSSQAAAVYDYAPMEAEYEEAYDSAYGGEYLPAPMPAAAVMDMPEAASPGDTRNGAKLIYSADLSMETTEFDETVSALAGLTAEMGGYYESSSLSERGSYRTANYTIRVPAERYRAFVDGAGSVCHVLSLREYTEDVSEAYYDTAGRLETQQTKLDRLQELLKEAENMEDIITIESAISETEELIDRLSGTLRHYDALVDYSTVTVYLEEVRVYEPDPPVTFGSRLGTAFTEGLKGFADGLGNILVALAYSWLWLLLIAAVAVLALWLTRKRRAEKKAERAERKARAAARDREPVRYTLPAEEKEDGREP